MIDKQGIPQLNNFINRELSWLAFNDRVLEEAQDSSYPLLERLKFLAIVSSNLDEFFMIRVAGREQKIVKHPQSKEADGLKTDDVLAQIREWALQQKQSQGKVLKELLGSLKEKNIYLQTQISHTHEGLMEFSKKLLPSLKIQEFKSFDSFNQLTGSRIYIFVRLANRFVIISWSDDFDRLIRLPPELSEVSHHFVLADKLITAAVERLFENETVLEVFPFKLIRDADVEINPDSNPEELLTIVEEAIQSRARRPVVRLEIDVPYISDGALQIANALKLHTRAVYRYDAPLDLKILWRLYGLEGFENLREKKGARSPSISKQRVPDLVKILRGQDILLHHPYDSFDTVTHLLQAAAIDPHVTEIRQTLYRTNLESPIVEALIEAAKNGKSVTVAIELRARFDEARNIQLAKELKKYGVKVLKGFAHKKIHCKLTQIIRKENEELTSFVHVGTGNYNPSTARLYTDLGLLTVNPVFARDAEKAFKSIESKSLPKNFEAFVAAPEQLQIKIFEWIKNEIKNAKEGKPAHIIVKVNALADTELVKALYEASQAGVKIDLIVRSACILRPGVPGLSENIRVTSIVGKYLEHSRIYYFLNSGDASRVYLSSADWMPRNLHNRIEIAFPIYDDDLKKYVREIILETLLNDNTKARGLMPDGRWVRVTPKEGQTVVHAQEVFQQLARSNYKNTPLDKRFILQKEDLWSLPEIGGSPH